jgi:phosphate:Na+ symporter
MRSAVSVAHEVTAAPHQAAVSSRAKDSSADAGAVSGSPTISTDDALVLLERSSADLGELRRAHRSVTLSAVAGGTLTADAALVRVDTVRSLEVLAYHAWRSAAHLVGRG